jgi:tetratricopeptide (TPR) repeat protein
MFGDLDNIYDDDETLDLLRRYKDMLSRKNHEFFDLYEFDSIIDYFTEQYNFRDAIKVVCIAIQQHPNASCMKLRYAQLLIETLKPGKALRILRGLGEAESDNYELFLAQGIALNMTGKYTEANNSFNKALKICEDMKDEVAYSIAQSYMQYGMYCRAVNYLLLAYHYNKNNILIIYDLGLCYDKLQDSQKSLLFYNKYLEIDPFAEHVWNNIGLLYTKTGKFDQASNAFDYSIAINPQFIPAYFSKADMFIMSNNLKEAIEVYNDILLEDSSNTKALCDMGRCFIEIENYHEAMKLFKSALDIAYDCADAWYGKSVIFFRLRKYGFSVNAIKKAISLDKGNPQYWYSLGEIYNRTRKLNKAIVAYTKATELSPDNFKSGIACAQVLFRKKRIQEAILMLNDIYINYPDNALINYRLAAYHAYQHNIAEAQHYFKKALLLNFSEHTEMFRHFPKTKSLAAFRFIMENQGNTPDSFIKLRK